MKLFKKEEKVAKSSSALKYGSYASIMTAIVVVAVIVINLMVSSFDIKFDLTENKLYSLSEDTITLVEGLDEEVTITSVYAEGSEITVITEILDKEQNFFVAFCLWDRYLQAMSRCFSGLAADEQRELNKEISKTGNEILTKYQQHCGSLLKRNADFKKLCPRKYGPWGYAPPRDFREMRKRIDSCFLAWRKMQSCSAFSEFPDWDSAALEVMQMVRSSELEQKFDTAYRNYQKLLNY